MKKLGLLTLVVAFGLLSVLVLGPVGQAAENKDKDAADVDPPAVFQAAGPTAEAIQSTIEAFRAALGEPHNLNASTFSPERLFTPVGSNLTTFSPVRLFTPVGSNLTQARFVVPGPDPVLSPATVRGFGVVFTVVDEPDGDGRGQRRGNPRGASTRIEYLDANGTRLFRGFVPVSPGDGSLSFFGIVFNDARIAQVRITTGNVAPGPEDERKRAIVIMDDFIYDEPQSLPAQ